MRVSCSRVQCTNPNSHSLANKFLNGACLLYINNTELCYDSHLAVSRENSEKKKLQSVFVVFILKQVAQSRTRPTMKITVDSRAITRTLQLTQTLANSK